MTNDFFRNNPYYNDDSDYNTNSNSFFHYLGKNNKLIKLLSKKIWVYDKELAKRFDEWDLQLENLDGDVKAMLNRWLADGTLTEVIANTIDYKSNIIVSEFEPIKSDDKTFWYKDVGKPQIETGDTVINTNVEVSENEPSDESKNVWFNL